MSDALQRIEEKAQKACAGYTDPEVKQLGRDMVKLARALTNTLRILKECGPAMLIAALHGQTCSIEVSERNGAQIEEAERALEEVAGE